ncbi:hypothetical protein OOK27_22160 [Streptomyces canus]|uniref:hypothetical protein n=1 Tax=Streptomyces canus TaxID=58343 RepID=UPI002250F430|nr:hypothetical protein [Streptomyces canus]MCX5256807.1 hypothetical protein [Streptomyces canus]
MKHFDIVIEGWWVAAFLAVLFAALASYSATQQDPVWAVIFGAICTWAIWETQKSYMKLVQRRRAEKAAD